jgi:hypothetical protein
MANSNSQVGGEERSETITALVPADETGVLAAEETLYDALGELQTLKQSGGREDLLQAQHEIMKAHFQIQDALDSHGDCRFLTDME